ncbi:MAG: MFS transporter [Ktedonobacteraceae bacterium]
MSIISTKAPVSHQKLSGDYWKFWTGQTISNTGSVFTRFILPLLVYKLTGSALALGLTAAAVYLPYLLVGLVIGALVDRMNRKRIMIITDLARAVVIASIPLLYQLGLLSMGWIYTVAFIQTTLGIFFESCEFAAIPSLVNTDELLTANGRIQASYSVGRICGPLLAGLLLFILPVPAVLLGDSVSFLISAFSLMLVRRSFNSDDEPVAQKSIGTKGYVKDLYRDIAEGLSYIFKHPVLRNISIMMALVNFAFCPIYTQIVFFAKQQFQMDNAQIGWFFVASSVGVIVFSLATAWVRKRWSFGIVALSTLMLMGATITIFALIHVYWIELPLWAIIFGLSTLYNINDMSLRQAVVPNEMLGRVITVENVISWSVIPLGTLLGGWLIQVTNSIVLVYAVCGILMVLAAGAFFFTALAHAERYLPEAKPTSQAG